MAFRMCISEAGASSPTALPICEALLLELVNTKAMRLSALLRCLSRAKRAAIPAIRVTRSAIGSYSINSFGSPFALALNDIGTVMMRPSNSGKTTFMAASSGLRPRVDSRHCASVMPLVMACNTGTLSCSKTDTDQPAGVVPPAVISPIANAVVLISTSICVPCVPLK